MTAQAVPAQEHDSAEPTPREDGRVGGPAGGPGAAASCPLLPHPLRRRLVRDAPAEPAVGKLAVLFAVNAGVPTTRSLYAAPAGGWRSADGPQPAAGSRPGVFHVRGRPPPAGQVDGGEICPGPAVCGVSVASEAC